MTNLITKYNIAISLIVAILMGVILNQDFEYIPNVLKVIIQLLLFVVNFAFSYVILYCTYNVKQQIEVKYNFYCLMQTVSALLTIFVFIKMIFNDNLNIFIIGAMFVISFVFFILASIEGKANSET